MNPETHAAAPRERHTPRDAGVDPRGIRGAAARKGTRYHIHHPFNVMHEQRRLHAGADPRLGGQPLLLPDHDSAEGRGDPRQLPGPRGAPRAGSSASSTTTAQRRRATGGIEAWLRLGEAVGLARDEVSSLRHVLPGVRFAVDAYVNFARRAPWQEAVCSSLTELFAPRDPQGSAWPTGRSTIRGSTPTACMYFRSRVGQARRDVEHGPRRHARSLHAPARSRSARSRSCSSSSTCCGRCSTAIGTSSLIDRMRHDAT